MKYGRYLKEHAQDEWRRQYINYRLLKKAIGKAEQELEEGAQPKLEGDAGGEAEQAHQSDADADGADDERDIEASPSGSASGFGGKGTSTPERPPSISSTRVTPASKEAAKKAKSARRARDEPYLTSAGDMNPRHWRAGYPPTLTLDELLKILPRACRRFFTLLDRELEKVSAFYQEREDEAVKRFNDLAVQWKELQAHRKAFEAYKEREATAPGARILHPIVAHVPRSFLPPGSNVVRRSIPSKTSENGTTDDATSRAPQDDRFLRGRSDDYASARSRLKLATYEFYRYCGILKSYRILNTTGFSKLKKFEKTTNIHCSKAYTAAKLQDVNFRSSTRLDELLRETEDAFTSVFEHGDRKKALDRLRQLGSDKTHHFAAWRGGLFIGAAIPLLLEGIVKSCQSSTRAAIPYWPALLQLFGAIFLPVLFSLLFFLNLVSWHNSRINYVLVFQLDIRTRIDMHQYLDIPAFLLFVFSLLFWAAFCNFWPDQITPSSYPLAFLAFALLFLLFPAPIMHADARWWSICSFARVFSGGLIRVEFRDFFLGDEMNSLYYTCYNLGFLYCNYHKGWPADAQVVCSTNHTWSTPILAAIPAFLRLGQSVRRYFDSDGLMVHLLNTGKYSATIGYYFAMYGWRIHGSGRDWRMAIFVIFAILNSSYSATWDLVMDWSLLRKQSKHMLLRPELGFRDHIWGYYVAMVIDVILRFTWIWYLIGSRPSVTVRGFVIALLEVCRRVIWNSYRVEAEHAGNTLDGYRVTRDIPLPYVIPGTSPQNDDDDVEVDMRSTRDRFFGFVHRVHSSVVKDFEPLNPFRRSHTIAAPRQDPRGRERSKSVAHDSSSPPSDADDNGSSLSEDDSDAELRKKQEKAEKIQHIGEQPSTDAKVEQIDLDDEPDRDR